MNPCPIAGRDEFAVLAARLDKIEISIARFAY